MIVHGGDPIADQKASHKAVGEADQTAHESDFIADKELIKQSEVWTDNVSTFENQPVGRNKNSEPHHNPTDDALQLGIQSKETDENDFFQLLLISGHAIR